MMGLKAGHGAQKYGRDVSNRSTPLTLDKIEFKIGIYATNFDNPSFSLTEK